MLGINPWKDLWIPSLPDKTPITKEGVDLGRWTWLIDIRKDNRHRWNESMLQDICDDLLVEAILKVNWDTIRGDDIIYWCGNTRGIFTVSNCYNLNYGNLYVENGIWKSLWKAKVHERLKIFA